LIEVEPYTQTQARKSTLVVAGVLALIGGWQAYRGRDAAVMALGAAVAALLVVAAIAPAAMWFHKWWMTLAGVLGYVNSRILLGAMFYLVLTPTGLLMRLLGNNPLERRRGDPGAHWHKRSNTRQTREGYERAF